MTKTFQKMLVPLDGSHLAEAVLPVVKVMAQRYHATVSLLHVMERGAPETIHGQSHLADVQQAQAYLSRIAEECSCDGVSVELHVHPNEERDVVASIIGHADEFGADLILITTHGSGGMRDLLVGSIAQQVLRRGMVPVVLVRPTASGGAPAFHGRHVLVPLAGTQDHDGAVLPLLESLASSLGAAIHLLMVVPTRETVQGDRAAVARFSPSAMSAALEMEQEDAQSYLEGIQKGLSSRGIPASAEVGRGDPAAIVAEVADRRGADLIIMSTHARSGWGAFWSASTGSKILGRLHQPILLVKAPQAREPGE